GWRWGLNVGTKGEWGGRRASIGSRKPMPVAIDDVPLPSRSTATSTSVSLVARLTLALRMPAGPRARALYQGRPDFATAAWRQRSGAGEGAPTALHRALISPRSSPCKRGPSLPISTCDPWVPASAGTNGVDWPAVLIFNSQSRSAPVVGWARGFA